MSSRLPACHLELALAMDRRFSELLSGVVPCADGALNFLEKPSPLRFCNARYIWLIWSCVVLVLDPLLSLAHSTCSGKGVFAVLLGSGVSRSAGVPTGWDLMLTLIRELATLRGEDAGIQPDEWFRRSQHAEPDYSAVLGALARTPAERRALLQPFFEPTEEERERGIKVPTPAHRAIARLAASGHVRIIVTTNFDRLMETALLDEGVTPVVVANGDQAEGAAPLVHQSCVVLKLHGDYLDDRIKNTEAELSTYDDRMAVLLDQVLNEFGLIVSGWSGEWDQALRSTFERCSSRRYSTYWGTVGDPGPRAADLIARRQAQVIRTAGADALFTAVEEKVRALDDLRMSHPLTTAVAVATLKRYIVEDRFRVMLEDLTRNEALGVARAIDDCIPKSSVPDAATMAHAIRALDGLTATLRAVFFHGCRLGRSEHDKVFLRSLPLLAPKAEWLNLPTYDVWRQMRLYPMCSVLYAGALGTVSSGRWGLLRELLTLRFKSCGKNRWVHSHLPAMFALDEAAARTVAGNTRLPASEHVFALLQPLTMDLVADGDALFDELEIWMCLAIADQHQPSPGSVPRIPVGRFMSHRFHGDPGSQPDAFFAGAAQAGAAWPPLSEGWFGGTEAGLFTARNHVESRVAQVASLFWG